MNIWVVRGVLRTPANDDLLGYATFPPNGTPSNGFVQRDGVVIHWQGFGRGNFGLYAQADRGRTTTHEIGHYLNLRHIWGDDGGSCTGTDEVADTPNQGGPTTECVSIRSDNCSNIVMSSDYMDYTDDACMGIFTLGQGTRARVNFEPGRYREQLGSRKAYISGAYWLFDCPSDYQTFTLNTEGFTIPSNAYIFWSVSSNIDIISGQGTPSITVRGKTISNGSVQNGSIYVNVANVGICNQTVNVPTTIENTITIYKWTDYNFDCSPSTSTCPNTGNISYQRWENIGGGNSIQDLRNNTNNLNNSPSNSQNLTLFEAPANILDNYGVRMRGYVCPPTSGNYIFWVAGDDNAELWLSPNDQPNNLSRIAYHNSWTPPREWNIFSTQQSAPIMLQAGQRYYVEALMKEGGGGDNLAVGWQLPNGSLERPIPGNRLIPFSSGGCTPPNAPSLSANPASINGGQSSTLSVSGCGGTVSWNTNQTGNSITVSPAQTTTYTATCSANGCTSGSGSVTVTVNGGVGGNCATGNFNGHFDYANFNSFSGWALDQNNFGRTVNVEIRVDGQLVATIPANQSRPDLVAGFGTPQAEFHGWTYNVPANAPWRNGTNRTASARICGATNDLNESPKTVNCTGGSGGCTPPAAPNLSANPASINGGQSSTLSASGCGGAVSWNTNQTGNSITVSPAQTTTYTATCSVNGCTSGSGSVTVTVNGGGGGCATGNFNGHLDYANCGNFGGWALDQNNFGRTIEVEILINGQLVATIPANQSRSDLVAAFGTPQAEFHGWTYNVPANAPWRNGTVAVVARPCGGSNNLINSPANVNFSNCRVGAIEDLTERRLEPPLLDLVLSPNPTDGQVRVETWLAEAGAVQIAVQDLTGRTAKGFDFKAKSGNFSQLLNLTDLPVGVYLLQLQTTQKRFVKKMILVR